MSMRKIIVAINGLGRIGRAFLRAAAKRHELEIVAANDIADLKNVIYLIKYDTVYGRSDFEVKMKENPQGFLIDGREVRFFSEREPARLPWKELGIDIVVESTGFFASYEKSRAHLEAGAKRVVISAPAKDEPPLGLAGATVLMGLNESNLQTCDISSNASCTTNAAGPIIAILDEALGIEKAVLNTVHAYTASQSLVDSGNRRGFREGRAAAANIVPSSTGAAAAVTKAYPRLAGLFDGISMRVPVTSGSIVDITFTAKRNTSAEEVNGILKKAAGEKRWQRIFSATEDELVSSDILGSPFASIADLSMTRVVGGNLVKVLAWYDNEMGYAHTLVEHVVKAGEYVK